jgi:pimeloyl-ACP methyl ester carboxylesterase
MSDHKPFNPEDFAKWLAKGIKETLQYRLKNSILSKDQILDFIQKKIPTRNQVFHRTLKQTFLKSGFEFELIQQGDALFHVIRKRFRPEGNRRLLLIPGLGDTPSSWIPPFVFSKSSIEQSFDEILMIDFPGYLGFLSHTSLVPSMTLLQSVVQMVVDNNAPSVIIGHSLGGWLAAKAAQNSKKPLDHLILVAPSGLTPVEEREAFGEFIISMQTVPFEVLMEKLVFETKPFHQFLKQEFNFFYSKPELRDFINSVKPEEFIDPKVSFRSRQVSVVWGESDEFVPAHWIRHWIECYGPELNAYVMRQVGHLPQLEKPAVLAHWIRYVLGQSSPASHKEGASESSAGGSVGWTQIHRASRAGYTDQIGSDTGKTEKKYLTNKS